MAKFPRKSLIKYLFFLLILIMLGWFLYHNIAEIKRSFEVTTSSLTGWILLSFLAVIVSQFVYIKAFQKAFSTSGLKTSFWSMLRLQLSAMAVNIIIPSASASGTLIFADEAKSQGHSRTGAVISYLVLIVSEYTAISVLLIISLLYLFFTRSLGARTYVPAGIFILLTIGFYYLLFASSKSTSVARSILTKLALFVARTVRSIFRRKFDTVGVVEKLAVELDDAKGAIQKNPRFLYQLILLTLICHIFRVVALYLVFLSLGFPITVTVLVAGYIIGVVLVVVSPTPSGVGFVEGAMYLMYTSLGVPGRIASTATIIYRFMQFWLPFLIGLVLLQRDRIKKITSEMEETAAKG